MSFNLNFPNITATSEQGKIEQIRGYLYQLVEQLKWALNSIEQGGTKVIQQSSQSATKDVTQEDSQATFNSIKALIIKSADIVEAYYEEISEKLVGEYVATSDFGTYKENTEKTVIENSKGVENLYKSVQEITTNIGNIQSKLIEVNARIKSGILDTDENGAPIYGLEIGQTNEIDGVEVFNKFARYTSDRLSFYDKNDTEVAYISDYKLYITNAQITGTLKLGRYEIDTSNGLAFKWV